MSQAFSRPLPTVFDERIERQSHNSAKWSLARKLLPPEAAAADPLPMWVADMDFRAPAPVLEALHAAVDHGVFGYPGGASASYLEAVTGWQARRFGWQVDPDWVVPASSVITLLKTCLQAFSAPGDSVLIQPPVYSHFHDDVLLNGRQLALAPLERTETGYRFDPQAFEAAIRPNTRLFILSNPHNPTGNVWSAEELRQMGEICAAHDILVISDEIHQDLIMDPARRHVPFASLGEGLAHNSVTCTAPSKTFNLPGLQCANAFVPDARRRAEMLRQQERNMVPLNNSLGLVACEVAYRHGEPWLEALLDYLRANHRLLREGLAAYSDRIKILPAPALYLAWLDCRSLGMTPDALEHFLLTRARLWLDRGPKFGTEGHGYMRINLGCPRSVVEEALTRLGAALETLDRPGVAEAGRHRIDA
ncbi:pyridoxal phosphate-dependent aminotransferase [Pseudooceanicola sp. CBS1P-1]|uniref:cysteine-S-conjugate beta-lyase n=1 Tax=Pseudooceanicola albus TaxID=2692189 RepID=A0A6L7G913_9RHOB|nr:MULTISPECIES: MalY/PatB family protein [Pseudooceanicola]MBT9386598.1 pyridoxal phosphate-dependent aminotransferase [Pseudooceanicola endophyticus]MXN20714.1 putative C-S lyase [Pseudooceanicola albus]